MGVAIITGSHYNVDKLFQWDKNQVLEIRGLSLPLKPEIHFTKLSMDRAIVRQSNMDESGIITVTVPNSLLQTPYPIQVYVCGYENETFKTYTGLEINIVPRTKPADYKLENDPEVYSFTELEYKVNNLNDGILKTVKSWIVNNLTTTAPGKILDGRQGKVLMGRIKDNERKTGVLADLETGDKSNIVLAINSLVTSVANRFGDLAQLKTKVKDSVVNAINELKSNHDSLKEVLTNHKKSTDHDDRYYTEKEIDTKIGDLTTLNTNEKTNIVGSINELQTGLTEHKSSEDHDNRYHTKIEIGNMIGVLTDLTTTAKDNIVNAINEIVTSITNHKKSGDHDNRYYKKTDIDKALNSKQDLIEGTPVVQNDIVDNLESVETNKTLSANQGKVLNDKVIGLQNHFNSFLVPAGVNNNTKLTFTDTFSAIVSVMTKANDHCIYSINGIKDNSNVLVVTQLTNTGTDKISVASNLAELSVTLKLTDNGDYHVSVFMLSGSMPNIIKEG